MTVNQSLVQQTVRNIAGTAGSYNSDWSAMFDQFGIASGDWNGRQLAWINTMLGTSYADLPGARAAYAAVFGVTNWDSLPGVYADILTDDLIAVTRADATATYFDNTGEIQTAAANTLRLDHNPATRAFRGLLVEPAATNTLFGNEFANVAVWGATNLNQTGTPPWVDVAVAPTGAQVAEALIENTATGEHRISATAAATLNASQSMSLFVKALPSGVGRSIRLLFGNNASIANNVSCVFNNSAGVFTVGTPVNSGTATSASAIAIAVGSGWYLITLSGVPDAAAGAGTIATRINLHTGLTASYAGDNESGVYIWSPQLEAGAVPTSSIVPGSSAITRNADQALIFGAAFSSIWPATEGTVYSEFEVRSITAAANRMIFDVSNVAGTERVVAYIETTGAVRYEVTAGGVTSVSQSPGSVVLGVNKFAAAFKANDCQCALNGVTSAVDNSATIPTGADAMGVGVTRNGASPLNGWIKSNGIIPLRVPENGLIGLTA